MSAWPEDYVLRLLERSTVAQDWTPSQWSVMVQQGRRAGLLARAALAVQPLQASGLEVPAGATAHFTAAHRLCRAQQAEVQREVAYLGKAFDGFDAPVVLLKGAAYVMAGLPPASGRIFGDIDILVPKAKLADAESRLMLHGWLGTHLSEYDQRYYRRWMHELPPMEHVHRGTSLDVHHTILPETARLHPDPLKLFASARQLPPPHQHMHVLAPVDMVLHSMTHLFMNDDMSHALRDLSDMDLLLRHFPKPDIECPDFWRQLADRAVELDLTRPLYYGLRYCFGLLGTPIPESTLLLTQAWKPPAWVAPLMDALWNRCLRSPHRSSAPAGTSAAMLAIYLRGHWLRMPPLLLARHLLIKAFKRSHEHQASPVPAAPP